MRGASLTKKGPGLAKLKKLFDKLELQPEVKIGILLAKDARTGNPPSNVAVGVIHEFGAPEAGIPQRSFLRATADAKGEQWMRVLEKALGKAIDGDIAPGDALELAGLRASADVRATIVAGIGPELAASTIRAKGSSKPLIDTAQVLNSITHAVEKQATK